MCKWMCWVQHCSDHLQAFIDEEVHPGASMSGTPVVCSSRGTSGNFTSASVSITGAVTRKVKYQIWAGQFIELSVLLLSNQSRDRITLTMRVQIRMSQNWFGLPSPKNQCLVNHSGYRLGTGLLQFCAKGHQNWASSYRITWKMCLNRWQAEWLAILWHQF